MLISCPNCDTNFSVPDSALGAKGRTLKCAKCGHKWFQSPAMAKAKFGLDEDSFPPPPPRPAPQPEPEPEPDLSALDRGPPSFAPEEEEEDVAVTAARAAAAFDRDVRFGSEPPLPDLAETSDGMGGDIPESLAKPAPARKKGSTLGLWLLLLVLLLACAGGGAYYFQDWVVQMWPPAEGLLLDAGLRHEKAGAGLELRHAGTPERMVYNDTDVLIVRGVVANASDRTRMVPPMKLMLYDKDRHVVQEKSEPPPATSLEPGATIGFKIQLQRPDANATEVVVVFVDPAEAPAK